MAGERSNSGSSSQDGEEKTESKEPKNRPITQQALPACKPVIDKTWVIFIFMAIAIVLIPIGVVCVVYGLRPQEVSQQYDDSCFSNLNSTDEKSDWLMKNVNNSAALTCWVTLNVTSDITGPVYVYYEISNMYQNHRRYVRSRSDTQLAGVDNPATATCDPQEYFNGNNSQLINPCGLIAWSFFNDTYSMQITRGTTTQPLAVSTTGIAYQSDINHRFANYTPQFFNPPGPLRGGNNITTTVQQNEQFMNWMRVSALPTFRKLWGKINTDLKAGDRINVTIVNQYNTYMFSGSKSIVLSNTTWLGGHSFFLGAVYIITGGLSLLLGLIYAALVLIKPRKFADISLLDKKHK